MTEQQSTQVVYVKSKNPGLAAILSFFYSGLGQIYNGQIAKGIIFIVVQVVNIGLMYLLIGFITYPIIWIWAIVDAYKVASKSTEPPIPAPTTTSTATTAPDTSPDKISLENETKKCPACAEVIKLEARKCRFCGEELDPEEVERQIADRRAKLADMLAKEREGKKQCPQCGSWELRWATTEDGGMGYWCDNCKKSLKMMGKG